MQDHVSRPAAENLVALQKFGIGQPVRRKEDDTLVRGKGRYTDDFNLPGQAYAVVVRSTHAHGVIRGIGLQVGTWPAALGNLPPNRTIVRAAATGEGKLLEDNSTDIETQLAAYNTTVPATGGAAGTAGTAGTAGSPGTPGAL